MMTNLLFSQASALGKRLAMVLTMLLMLGIGQVWGAEVTASGNIVSGNTYYIKGVRSSATYYLKFTDSKGSQKGTETSSTNDAIPITFIAVSGGWNLKTPNGNYIAPGTSNGTINVSTTAITVAASDQKSKIRLSIVNNSTTWSIQKNTSAANFGGYKNTQTDITLVEANPSTTINPTITFSDGSYTIGNAALDLSKLFTTNSTGNVTYTVQTDGSTGATISGTSFTATAAGTCTVLASQEATSSYNSATATATITVSAPAGGDNGDGECSWTLVTDASTLKADDEIIIAASEDNNYAISTNQANNNRTATTIIKEGNTLTAPSDAVQILTLKTGTKSGTWAFYTGTGYLYAASSSNNYLRTQTTNNDNGSFTITIVGNVATIVAQGTYTRNTMRYNPNGGNPVFACYASSSSTGSLPCIYKKVCTTETSRYLTPKHRGDSGGT